jgi:DNA-binding NtrC family response regulator
MTAARILVVEDEKPQRDLVAGILTRDGHQVREAGTVDDAVAVLEEAEIDLVLCDWRLPGRDGGELLTEVADHGWDVSVVVMTAYGSIAHAVEAVQRGAVDYLAKPFERDALRLAVTRVLRTRSLEAENRRLRGEPDAEDGYGELIGRAPAMRALYRTIDKVAGTDATVLVAGESGTGKELVARTLHRFSRRADGPFVAVNCAAIPESLIESELFGHEKGAFTGAHRRRLGRFEEAEGGTLFLDEIASMPLQLQSTLLRVLQEKRFTRVGGSGEVACDVRIVAASNRDLLEMVGEGVFREDLYYRLCVMRLDLPALRERREDIPRLAAALLDRARRDHGLTVQHIPAAVLRRFMEYPWPGNVRELGNVVERLALLAEGDAMQAEDLPPEMHRSAATPGSAVRLPPEGLDWDRMEEDLLRQALDRTDGNRAAAARLLGLTYKAFLYRVEKFGL